MRWKIFFFDKEKDNNRADTETYGFNTEKTAPIKPLLTPFENDIYAWLNTIKFSKHRSTFQKKLTRDRKDIQSSTDAYVPADKSTNIYKMSANDYTRLLHGNVTTNYKKSNRNTKSKIDREAKQIAAELNLADRIERIAEREAFVTLKDHKENFENNPKCRLINPAKSEIGIISKHHLQSINSELRQITGYLQWTSTQSVLTCVENLEYGNSHKLMQLDIVEFYPSITEKLLSAAITYAQSLIDIDQKTVDIIMHSRQSLLFTENSVWVKKNNDLFDVTMGSYDGAEVCELVGLYLLNEVKTSFPNISFGLYRDDGLGYYTNMSGPETERMKKAITKLFKNNGLSITINMNMRQANFLDVTMYLETGVYHPYRKPGNAPLYIDRKSNHPPSITKQIPTMIQTRLSNLSSSTDEFDKVKDIYCDALAHSGFNRDMKFQKSSTNGQNTPKRNRKRKTLWFNPPYNEAVRNSIEKEFYQLIDKHFPRHHKYYPIFNRHNIRLSYSCTQNMKAIISSHNKKLLNTQATNENKKTCNCRRGTACPMNGACLTPAIVYNSHVETEDTTELYIGVTEPPWNQRYNNHKSNFTHVSERNTTTLSKRIWELRDSNAPEPTITWSIQHKSYPYRCGTRICDLCLSEKLAILKVNTEEEVCLNSKSEIMNKCRHSLKYKLINA